MVFMCVYWDSNVTFHFFIEYRKGFFSFSLSQEIDKKKKRNQLGVGVVTFKKKKTLKGKLKHIS